MSEFRSEITISYIKNLMLDMYINRGCGNSTPIVHDVKVHLIVPRCLGFRPLGGRPGPPRSLVQHIRESFFFVYTFIYLNLGCIFF